MEHIKAAIIDAGSVKHVLSRYMTGSCIEDVNHEIYGGLYSQMLFGESFQELPELTTPEGFNVKGGFWPVSDDGELSGLLNTTDSAIISKRFVEKPRSASVDVFLPERDIGRVVFSIEAKPAEESSRYTDCCQVSLHMENVQVSLNCFNTDGNWSGVTSNYSFPIGRWFALQLVILDGLLELNIDGQQVLSYIDKKISSLTDGRAILQLVLKQKALFRNLSITSHDGKTEILPFMPQPKAVDEISRMWLPIRRGTADGNFALYYEKPYVGEQSQIISFTAGEGEIGLANMGLNRQGMYFAAEKQYEGFIIARTDCPVELRVAMENSDGSTVYSEQKLSLAAGNWQKLEFFMMTGTKGGHGRFVVSLCSHGTLTLGYAFLQPGEWGRFKGLPVRRDLAEAMIEQGNTVLRYGGSMVDCSTGYRWKNMIGPREERQPYHGTWYRFSTNGWGIIDFLDFCEAAGFAAIPTLNMDETPQDIADFIEYVNGPVSSKWGSRRVSDGHPESYKLRYIALGNEERVDANYYEKFRKLAETLWNADKDLILTVGDYGYTKPIVDIDNLTGAKSGITNMQGQRLILDLAEANNRPIWFDIHLATERPNDPTLDILPTFDDAIEKLSPDMDSSVVVYELNAKTHNHLRALSNALTLVRLENYGKCPVVCSANALQVDKQNDNLWNQGLVFCNPEKVWLQPPAYVTRMFSKYFQPNTLAVEQPSDCPDVELSAQISDDRKTLVIKIVNYGQNDYVVPIEINNFVPLQETASVEILQARPDDCNTADEPQKILPKKSQWTHGWNNGRVTYQMPAYSVAVLVFS